MRFIEIKIFDVNSEYFLLIEKIKLSNKSKIIEQEYCKEVQTKKDAEYYLTTILNNKEYRKYRFFINYNSNDVIIEVINNSKELKNNYLNELNIKDYRNHYLFKLKKDKNNKDKIKALVDDLVNNTKELGHFKIQKEEASSAGVRRIKAILE